MPLKTSQGRSNKGDEPLTKHEIGSLREQTRSIYSPDSSDSQSVRKFKETRLADAEAMFTSALSGDLPITGDTTKDAIPTIRKELADFKVLARNRIDATQKALDADIKVRDSVSKIFSQPPIDENDKEEMELRESMKGHLARANNNIEKYQRELAELRA